MTRGMDTVRHELEKAITYEVQDKRIPSISYALVDRVETLASGHIVLDCDGRALTDEGVFRVGSCSKMFTGIALMQLVEQAKVSIDEDIAQYVPGFSPHNPFARTTPNDSQGVLTLRKLMSHTAGMVREATAGHYLDDSIVSVERMVEELQASTLKENPDACVFHYSNAGIAVVGYVVQRTSGVDLATYIKKNVLNPLGMQHSSFTQTPYIRDHLATAYMWTLDEDLPAPVFDMGGGGAAGNLFSTIPEMAEFVRSMLRGGFTTSGESVLATEMLHQMWEPVARKGKAAYGLTFAVGSLDGWKSVGHGGAVYGYASQLVFLPEAGLGIVLCATLDSVNAVIGRLGAYGLRLALAANRMGQRPKAHPVHPKPSAMQLQLLPGFFQNKASGETVEVVRRDHNLYLLFDGVPFRIQPASATEFEIDGRTFGPGSEYAHLSVVFGPWTEEHAPASLLWQDVAWRRIPEVEQVIVPEEILPCIGEYGPDFNITHVFYNAGGLKCRMEYFHTHTLERVCGGTYRMHGLLYDNEILEFVAKDGLGQEGIRVGSMFLARRPPKVASGGLACGSRG